MTQTPLSGHADQSAYAGKPINGRLLLTIAEAAVALHISRYIDLPTVRGGRARPWVQIGASRRVTSAEIHRFIAAHTEAAS